MHFSISLFNVSVHFDMGAFYADIATNVCVCEYPRPWNRWLSAMFLQVFRGSGEIGRRAGFRFQCRKA